jgi:hypothetical protein
VPLLAALMADMMASQTGETLSLLKFRLNGIPRQIVRYAARRARRAAIVSDLRRLGQRRQSPASNSKVWPSRCQMTALLRTVKNQVCCSKGLCGLKHEG